MKIHFDNVNFGSSTGPNTFANRLARSFFELEHEIVPAEKADISLVFIEMTGQQLARRVVHRLDGIWFKPDEFATKNVGIRSTYDAADAVVYQSEFDKTMITKWFGAPARARTTEVIKNGINIAPLKSLTIPALMKLRSEYEQMYVCSASWHPQKRLRMNVELFKHLRKNNPSSCLIVLGANPDYVCADKDIFYAGHQPHDVCNEIYAAADWMLHLAWADHSPNTVVEALSQGTPVACSSVGGTRELIGTYGIVLEDVPYEYELCDYDNPPVVDMSNVGCLPNRSTLDYSSVTDIDIATVSAKYITLFESLINDTK